MDKYLKRQLRKLETNEVLATMVFSALDDYSKRIPAFIISDKKDKLSLIKENLKMKVKLIVYSNNGIIIPFFILNFEGINEKYIIYFNFFKDKKIVNDLLKRDDTIFFLYDCDSEKEVTTIMFKHNYFVDGLKSVVKLFNASYLDAENINSYKNIPKFKRIVKEIKSSYLNEIDKKFEDMDNIGIIIDTKPLLFS